MSQAPGTASARSRNRRWRRIVVTAAAMTVLGSSAAAATSGTLQPDAGEGSPGFYMVVQGDGFQHIAATLGVPIDSLLARNGLTVDFTLHPGYVLIVPEADFVPPSTVAPPETSAAVAEETAPPDEVEPTEPPPATQPPAATQPPGTPPPGTQPPGTQPPPPPPTEPPTTPAPTAPPTPAPAGFSDCVVGGIGWINNARANEGLPAIGQGDAGNACAHSRNMAEAGDIYHGAGGCGWEIVGYSSSSADDLPGAWLNSPGHYGVVTAPEITSGAVAYVQNLSNGYWYGTGTFC